MVSVSDTEEKADVLNNYFESVYMIENLSNIPIMGSTNGFVMPGVSNVTFLVDGIQH